MEKYVSMTDEQLVHLYEQGEDSAFDSLLERHQEALFTYILILTRDRQMADDVFQDTFVRAIMAIRDHRYRNSGSFYCWLMCIAHNIVLDMARKRHNNPTTSQEFIKDDGDVCDMLNNADLCEPTIEGLLFREQNHTYLRELITRLPASQREIIYMRYYRDMPFKEIAQVLGISINTALGRVHYAIQNLRRMSAHLDLYEAV